jgi:hypothetical protein
VDTVCYVTPCSLIDVSYATYCLLLVCKGDTNLQSC